MVLPCSSAAPTTMALPCSCVRASTSWFFAASWSVSNIVACASLFAGSPLATPQSDEDIPFARAFTGDAASV